MRTGNAGSWELHPVMLHRYRLTGQVDEWSTSTDDTIAPIECDLTVVWWMSTDPVTWCHFPHSGSRS